MTVGANSLPPTALERVLARDRRLIAASLAALVILAWSYLLGLSQQMNDSMPAMTSMPGMSGMPGMSDPTATADVNSFALTAAMWWTMMIGMMVPSATPMILLFGNVQRRQLADESPRLRVALFATAYLATWGAFSLLAAAAQLALVQFGLLESMSLTANAWLGAVLIALAGIYQLTPLKTVCLRRCRSPAEFLSTHWRPGTVGALRMGVGHGVYCVGCCWLLMGLLFAVGVMNLLWVAAIAAFVLVEKLLPHGDAAARIGGAALLLFAAYRAFSA